MQVRYKTLLLALGVVAAASACTDDPGFASFANREVDITVYAMSGTAQVLPAGIEVRGITVTRIDPSWAFDLAFDLDAQGGVVVHTVRAIASEILQGNVPRVGLQIDTTGFPRVLRAPTSGFTYDSSLTVPLGQTVIIDKIDPSCNRFGGVFLGFNIRAKMRIDSVSSSKRAIYVHMLSNPNCGFRSLQPGEPKD